MPPIDLTAPSIKRLTVRPIAELKARERSRNMVGLHPDERKFLNILDRAERGTSTLDFHDLAYLIAVLADRDAMIAELHALLDKKAEAQREPSDRALTRIAELEAKLREINGAKRQA